jgi:type II secretory pathway component PulJ
MNATALVGKLSRRDRRGSTLFELLVAISVLLVMMTFLAGMVGSVSASWIHSREKLDNFTRGRALINVLNRDLASAAIRQDLPAFVDGNGQPALAFYSRETGAPASGQTSGPGRPLSYVAYSLASDNSLQRRALAFDFSTAGAYHTPVSWSPFGGMSGNVPSLAQAVPQELCGGVFGFSYEFLQTDGSIAAAYVPRSTAGLPNSNPTCAVRVSLAILGDQALQALTLNQKANLPFGFSGAVPNPSLNAGSVKTAWDNYVATLRGTYPPIVLGGIRTYERITYLDASPLSISP